jgi:hypothetical protein
MSTTASDNDDDQQEVHPIDQREKLVLYLLFQDAYPWTLDELTREIGKEAETSVGSLVGAGLLHRFGDFVMPTRAARRSDELDEGAI